MKVYNVVNLYTDVDGDLVEGRVAATCDTKETALKYVDRHWKGRFRIKEVQVLSIDDVKDFRYR